MHDTERSFVYSFAKVTLNYIIINIFLKLFLFCYLLVITKTSPCSFGNLRYCTYVDIQKFNIKYLVMYKVQMHTGAIS